MTSAPPTTIQSRPTVSDIRTALRGALAEIRQIGVAELEGQQGGGDVEIESPEAVAAIAIVEQRFGRRLARVEDLEPEQLTSLNTLAGLLHRRWPTAPLLHSASAS